MSMGLLIRVVHALLLFLSWKKCAMLLMLEIQELFFQGKVLIIINFSEKGAKIFPLSRDHKPSDELEKKRIMEAGG